MPQKGGRNGVLAAARGMSGLSLNLLRPRDTRQRLPVYEALRTPPPKERDSNDSYEDSDDDGSSDISSPSTNNSRYTSSSFAASTTPIGSKRPFALPRRPVRFGPQLPSKVVRYLCLGLISVVILFIFSLVRASQNENHRLLKGEVPKKPPPPPIWESFPFLTRYYGGIRNLVPLQENVPEFPRPDDEPPIDKLFYVNFTHPVDSETASEGKVSSKVEKRAFPMSKEFIQNQDSIFKKAPENINECFIDRAKKMRVPPIRYYEGRPSGFPQAVGGSYELLDLNEDICYERYGRYGPYGLGYSVRTGGLGIGEHGETEGAESTWERVPQIDWTTVDWADAQSRCYQQNAARYKPLPPLDRSPSNFGFYMQDETNVAVVPRSQGAAQGAAPGAAPNSPASDPSSPLGKPATETVSKGSATKEEAAQPSTSRPPANAPTTDSQGPPTQSKTSSEVATKKPRTAVVVRCWDEYFFREEDVMNIRSLITELSLASGGRYDIHLLVQIKFEHLYPVFADKKVMENRLKERIPAEFHGLVTIWTETQMLSLYQGIHDLWTRGPDLPVHGVYRGLTMAMQYFAYQHPEYDYFWQWEMDIRYTGHYYDFFTKVENWAKAQPRKGLWERNSRFYFPSVHETWDDFKQMARVQNEMGTNGPDSMWNGIDSKKKPGNKGRGEKTVWGPVRPIENEDWFEPEKDDEPKTTYEKDKYVWGVGEEADYITFNPLFDPEGTTWLLADDITGYNTTRAKPPRRANIITASRLSRRLLMTMHRETAFKKHFAFPEMWPGTVTLQHGYKGVFVPHPIYLDREWPVDVFARTLNNGKNGASGGARTSVFGQPEHNLRGLTWFYSSGFAPNLYRRWLGLKVNNDGGEEFELNMDNSRDAMTVGEMRGGEGRMCLPPMLLHPIKDVDMPVERSEEGEVSDIPESDPAA